MGNSNPLALGATVEPKPDEQPSFKFSAPPPGLARFVEYLFCSQVTGHFANRIEAVRLPEAEAQLVFVIEEGNCFPGSRWLADGLRVSLFLHPGHLQVIPIPVSLRLAVGVALRPAGLRLLLPRGVGNLLDVGLIPLEDLLGEQARTLLARLVAESTPSARLGVLQSYLAERAVGAPPPNCTVARAIELIRAAHGEISTEQLAEACGCTSRTLRSATVAEVGLAPKHLARIVRIRHALDLLANAGVRLSDAAAASAFSDQAHMSREFRDLIGAPPSRLSERIHSRPLPHHSAERNLMSTGLLIVPKGSPIAI